MSLLGGSLLAALLLKMNFLAFAVPGLIAALAMGFFILWYRRNPGDASAAVTSPAPSPVVSH